MTVTVLVGMAAAVVVVIEIAGFEREFVVVEN